jgi:hypothetical protein
MKAKCKVSAYTVWKCLEKVNLPYQISYLMRGQIPWSFQFVIQVSFLAMTKCDKLHSVSISLFLLPALLNKHAAARTTSVL